MLVALLLLQNLVSFATVAEGAISAVDERRHVVVRTAEEWQTLWSSHSPTAPAPAVDFAQSVVVGVFLGARPTDGFSVEITSVREEDNGLLVEYCERRPDPAALVGQIVTSPFHLVTLPRGTLPRNAASIEFRQVSL